LAYVATNWQDRQVPNPLQFIITGNVTTGGIITLQPNEGVPINGGTPVTASNLNNMENGIAGAIQRTGDTMTGTLKFSAGYAPVIQDYIKFTDGTTTFNIITCQAGDTTGMSMAVQSGGLTIIGGGESAVNFQKAPQLNGAVVNPQTETMYVTSDNNVYILTYLQSYASDKTLAHQFAFKTNGDFELNGNVTDQQAGIIKYTPSTTQYDFYNRNATGTSTNMLTVAPTVTTVRQSGGNWTMDSITNGAIAFGGGSKVKFMADGSNIQIRNNADSAYVPILASAFTVSSMAETKTNIEPLDSALDKVNGSKVYKYTLKQYVDDNGNPRPYSNKIGLIYEEVPTDLHGADDGIDLYSVCGLLWKAVQELSAQVNSFQGKPVNAPPNTPTPADSVTPNPPVIPAESSRPINEPKGNPPTNQGNPNI
jgi:Chaperone of endosialidase